MHIYPFRTNIDLFERIRIEANSRGISINRMINYLIEVGLLTLMEREVKNDKIKSK